MCGSVSLFCFCDSRGSPRSRADPLSLSCPPFMHSFPLFFPPLFLYTHSSFPPSLLARRWMALSLWWVTDEWSSSLKSRVTARLVKREEMLDKNRRREKGERKEGRKRWRRKGCVGGGGGGGWGRLYSTREKRQTVNIHKVSWGTGAECVWQRGKEWESERARESVVCIFAWAPPSICIVTPNMQKAGLTQAGNNPRPDEDSSVLQQAFWTGGLWFFMVLERLTASSFTARKRTRRRFSPTVC